MPLARRKADRSGVAPCDQHTSACDVTAQRLGTRTTPPPRVASATAQPRRWVCSAPPPRAGVLHRPPARPHLRGGGPAGEDVDEGPVDGVPGVDRRPPLLVPLGG